MSEFQKLKTINIIAYGLMHDGSLNREDFEEVSRIHTLSDIGSEMELKKIFTAISKELNCEHDTRTDITGHFTNEYDQGFYDGFDHCVGLFKKHLEESQ